MTMIPLTAMPASAAVRLPESPNATDFTAKVNSATISDIHTNTGEPTLNLIVGSNRDRFNLGSLSGSPTDLANRDINAANGSATVALSLPSNWRTLTASPTTLAVGANWAITDVFTDNDSKLRATRNGTNRIDLTALEGNTTNGNAAQRVRVTAIIEITWQQRNTANGPLFNNMDIVTYSFDVNVWERMVKVSGPTDETEKFKAGVPDQNGIFYNVTTFNIANGWNQATALRWIGPAPAGITGIFNKSPIDTTAANAGTIGTATLNLRSDARTQAGSYDFVVVVNGVESDPMTMVVVEDTEIEIKDAIANPGTSPQTGFATSFNAGINNDVGVFFPVVIDTSDDPNAAGVSGAKNDVRAAMATGSDIIRIVWVGGAPTGLRAELVQANVQADGNITVNNNPLLNPLKNPKYVKITATRQAVAGTYRFFLEYGGLRSNTMTVTVNRTSIMIGRQNMDEDMLVIAGEKLENTTGPASKTDLFPKVETVNIPASENEYKVEWRGTRPSLSDAQLGLEGKGTQLIPNSTTDGELELEFLNTIGTNLRAGTYEFRIVMKNVASNWATFTVTEKSVTLGNQTGDTPQHLTTGSEVSFTIKGIGVNQQTVTVRWLDGAPRDVTMNANRAGSSDVTDLTITDNETTLTITTGDNTERGVYPFVVEVMGSGTRLVSNTVSYIVGGVVVTGQIDLRDRASDENAAWINLATETIQFGRDAVANLNEFTVASFSIDGGQRWRNGNYTDAMFAKNLNRDVILMLADRQIERSTRRPAGDAIIVQFARIQARPKAPRVVVNYAILAANDRWTLAPRGATTAFGDIGLWEASLATGRTADWSTTVDLTTGVSVKEAGRDRYFARVKAIAGGTGGANIASSKTIRVMSIRLSELRE